MRLTDQKRAELSRQAWAVETYQQLTQNSICERLAQCEGKGYGTRVIKYYRRQPEVYIVPFSVVEYLVTNRSVQGFEFKVFHDERNEDDWILWREEVKRIRVKSLREKSAIMFRQR